MKKFLIIIAILSFSHLTGCTNWGEMIENNKGQVYYKDPVTKAQAEELGKYLTKIQYFDGIPKSVQVLKDGNNYTVNFVVKEGAEQNAKNVAVFKKLSPVLSYGVFNEAIVNVALCDDQFKTILMIPGFNFGKRLQIGNDELFYEKPVNDQLAKNLGEFLRQSGFFQGTGLQAQLKKDGNIYQFRYVVKKGVENDDAYKATVRAFGSMISSSVLNNEKCDIHLCDDLFTTLTAVTAN